MPKNQSQLPKSVDLEDGEIDMKQALERFKRLSSQTSYRNQFGEPPKAAEDYVVLK